MVYVSGSINSANERMNEWMNEMNVILSEVFYSTIDLLLYVLLKGSSDATFTLQVFF